MKDVIDAMEQYMEEAFIGAIELEKPKLVWKEALEDEKEDRKGKQRHECRSTTRGRKEE